MSTTGDGTGTRAMHFAIFASPKSGTTWIQRLLCAHPETHCAEGRHFGSYLDSRNPTSIHISLERFVENLAIYYHPPVAPDLAPAFYRSVLHGMVDAIARTAIDAGGKPVYGEKITPFVGTAGQVVDRLHEYNPGLRFVHLVRDGRDVMASGLAHQLNIRAAHAPECEAGFWRRTLAERHMPDEMVEPLIRAWEGAVRAGLDGEARFEHALRIRYEDLVADTPGEATRLFEFIGADASRAVVEACVEQASFRRLSGGRTPGQEDLSSFFRKGTPGDWRSWFTREQGAAFDDRFGNLLDGLGYARSGACATRAA